MDFFQTRQGEFNMAFSLYEKEIRNGVFLDTTFGGENISRKGNSDIPELLQFSVGM